MNIILAIMFAFLGTLVPFMRSDLLGILCCGILWFCAGGLMTWDLIRRYRKSLGFKEDPFEPENIYLT